MKSECPFIKSSEKYQLSLDWRLHLSWVCRKCRADAPVKFSGCLNWFCLFCCSFIFFNWSIIVLQYCDSFCCTTTWISCKRKYILSLWSPPPTPLGRHRAPGWAPCAYSSFPPASSLSMGFPGGPEVKNLPANTGDMGSTPGSGRSPGEGNGNPLQYSCLENPVDRWAWWATVHRVAKESDMTWQLNNECIHVNPSLPVPSTLSFPQLCPQVHSLCLHLYSYPAGSSSGPFF